MSDTTALDAAKIAIRRATRDQGPRPVLYVPSVLAEAADLLSKLYAAGEEHQITPNHWDAVTNLPTGVLDALTARYCSRVQLTTGQLHSARDALTGELTAKGLTVRPGHRIAVAPLVGGPSWGGTGLSLNLSRDGWDISIDRITSPPRPIAAPPTEKGAVEVADLVGEVLRGEAPDPFQRLKYALHRFANN